LPKDGGTLKKASSGRF